MPKERRDRVVSKDRCKANPYPRQSSSNNTHESDEKENLKEWEETRCPVCMEHPHNAVLLICSSHENGCRPYMCNTSRRHSNCLDQFRKSALSAFLQQQQETESSLLPLQENPSVIVSSNPVISETISNDPHEEKLACPLCRGKINGWIIDEAARGFMNAKPRDCSCESCDFIGTYKDLRKHARTEHPMERPCKADPEREHNWRRLERERDLGDVLSTLRSSLEGEGGEEYGEDSILPFGNDGWSRVFFLVRMFQSGVFTVTSRWSGMTRARVHVSVRRRRSTTRLWGETFDREYETVVQDEESSNGGQRRRRTRRWTTPDNQWFNEALD